MYAIKITAEHLQAALDKVNEKYDGNIRWRQEPEARGRRLIFTLTVKNSRGPGGRRSASAFSSGRRVCAACWHVHGDFFAALFALDGLSDGAAVKVHNRTITGGDRAGGNWHDWQIGSAYNPMMYSDACDCNGGWD